MECWMPSLYYTQYRSKTGLSTASLHVYRSHYDRATKQVFKKRIGVVPTTGAGVPPELAKVLSAEELLEVEAKAKDVVEAAVRALRARADLLEQGLLP
jgi:hypothetical protein